MSGYLQERLEEIIARPTRNRPHWNQYDLIHVAMLLHGKSPEHEALARIEGLATFEPLGSNAEHRKQIWRIARRGLGLPT